VCEQLSFGVSMAKCIGPEFWYSTAFEKICSESLFYLSWGHLTESSADVHSGEGIGRRLCITRLIVNELCLVKPECCCVNLSALSICLSNVFQCLNELLSTLQKKGQSDGVSTSCCSVTVKFPALQSWDFTCFCSFGMSAFRVVILLFL